MSVQLEAYLQNNATTIICKEAETVKFENLRLYSEPEDAADACKVNRAVEHDESGFAAIGDAGAELELVALVLGLFLSICL